MFAMVGSIFLWMFWPSFNSALASGATQHRVMINTVLGISGSVIGGVNVARIFFGKLEMEILLNATLAGGVAIGSASDIITTPWAAIFIGYWGGVLSAIGF
jgi:ammonium transporter Rh